MDFNAYLPFALEGLGGAAMAGLVAAVLGGRAVAAIPVGLVAGIGLGFWLEGSGQLGTLAQSLGGGRAGLAAAPFLAGAGGGALAGLALALLVRRRR
jgi:hypothetical protein